MKYTEILKGRKGFIKFKTLFTLLVLALLVYAGIEVIPLYIGNYMLEQEVSSAAEMAMHKSDADINKRLVERANSWGITLKEGDIKIERGEYDVSIYTAYDIEVNFLGQYKKKFAFDIDVVKPIQKVE
ncbi:MAG: hypothetical protein A2073_08410 [Deltaproteobacteria bacterium GWC2_42_11]|nr:MAG: hypothetical protein A2073_08410 [Deltaproteobacteria bacterium GWC2_42_11]HBO84141.1 hypothetical protein [Deltaproteobacteria bacterium]